MKKTFLFIILSLNLLILSGCYRTEDVKNLVANEVTRTIYTNQMKSSEALFTLMEENDYQTSDFEKFTFNDDKLSFVLKKDIFYTKKVEVKPTTLTVEVVGPLNKKKDIIELTYFSYNKMENGEETISKEKINELVENAIKTKKKQEFEFEPDDEVTKTLGFKHQLTLKVTFNDGVITILAKETFEYSKVETKEKVK
jgi:hypothetical protein